MLMLLTSSSPAYFEFCDPNARRCADICERKTCHPQHARWIPSLALSPLSLSLSLSAAVAVAVAVAAAVAVAVAGCRCRWLPLSLALSLSLSLLETNTRANHSYFT